MKLNNASINNYMNLSFIDFFEEAISLKDAKRMGLNRDNGGAYNIDIINKIFSGKDRLIYPIDVNDEEIINKTPHFERLQTFLYRNGYILYNIKDYKLGVAYKNTDEHKKQPFKIGKILNKIKTSENETTSSIAEETLKIFRDDPLRTKKPNESGYSVVISRHPYDIAGMSTDRHWTSCMNLGLQGIQYNKKERGKGQYAHKVPLDISKGTIIAYLVKNSDKHPNGKFAINKPLARSLLKPYTNIKNPNEYAYSRGRIYGTHSKKFEEFLNNWVEKNINTDTENKNYILKRGLYPDNDVTVNFNGESKNNEIVQDAFTETLHHENGKNINSFSLNPFAPMGGGRGVEIEIVFHLDKVNNIESFRYETDDIFPKYINNFLKFIPKTKNKTTDAIYTTIEEISFYADTKTLYIKVSYIHNMYEPEMDEKGDEIPENEDDEFDYWVMFFNSIGFDNYIHSDAKKSIQEIILDSDIELEKKKELNDAKIKINEVLNHLKFQEEFGKFKSNYNKALKIKDYFVENYKNLSLEEVSNKVDDPEFIKNKEFLHNFFITFSRLLNISRNNFMGTEKDYAHIDINKIWAKAISDYIGVEKYYDDFQEMKSVFQYNTKEFKEFRNSDKFDEEKIDRFLDIKDVLNNLRPYVM